MFIFSQVKYGDMRCELTGTGRLAKAVVLQLKWNCVPSGRTESLLGGNRYKLLVVLQKQTCAIENIP